MKTFDQNKQITIVGIELRTDNEKAMKEIPPFWGKFYQEGVLAKIPNKVSEDVYAVYTNFAHPGKDNKGTYSLIIGTEVKKVDKLPAHFVSCVIPASKRAVFEVETGHPEKVGEKWVEIWGIKELKHTYIADYEHYHKSGKIEIMVGVK